jgi:hypothetical protein
MKTFLLACLLLLGPMTLAQTAGLAAPPAYAVATGSVNVLAVTQPGATLRAGQAVVFLPNLANTTTTPTLNVNGLGAVTITKNGTAALAAGDLTTTAVAMVFYDGTEFQLLNPQTTNTTGGLTGVTAWAAGTGTLPTQPSNSAGFMGPVTGGTAYAIQLPATMTAGFARFATPSTVNGWNAAQLTSALINVNDLTGLYITGGGTAQAQTATLSPAATALSAGLHVYWKPAAANSAAAPTLAVNGLTATAITKCGTTALVANDLTTTAVAHVIYDGTQYQLLNPQAAGCGASGGGLPTGATGQGVYYATGGTTGTASSATTTTNAASGFAYGINDTTPVAFDIGGAMAQFANYTGTVTLSATCSATATSCTIAGGANLAPNGGYLLIGYANGSNNQEWVCYSAATSTTLTIGGGNCQTPVTTTGRSYFGSTAASHNSGDQIVQVLKVLAASASGTIYEVVLGNGANGGVAILPGSASNFSSNISLMSSGAFLALGGLGFSTNPNNSNGGFSLSLANAAHVFRNTNANASLVTNANVTRNVSTQSITTTGTFASTATAITAAVTEAVPNNNTTASNTIGGMLQATCQVLWQQATAVSTAQWGVKLSAAPTSLTVIDEDYNGTSVTSSVPVVITTTTTTATSPAITPAAINTTYWTKLTLIMDPGTSNSPTVTLYGNSGNASDAVVIQKGSGCTGWN